MKQYRRRTHLSATGSFVSVPSALKDVDPRLRNAVKMEFKTVFSGESGAASLEIDTVFSTDRVLIDIGAVDPSALDFQRIARDCEEVRRAVLNHPEQLRRLVEAFQPSAPNRPSDLDEAYNIVRKIKLTEEDLRNADGGLIGLVIVLVGVALAGRCAHCGKYVKPDKGGNGD